MRAMIIADSKPGPQERRSWNKDGGEGGIRTPGTGFSRSNCLAGSPVRPLQHLSELESLMLRTLQQIPLRPHSSDTGQVAVWVAVPTIAVSLVTVPRRRSGPLMAPAVASR